MPPENAKIDDKVYFDGFKSETAPKLRLGTAPWYPNHPLPAPDATPLYLLDRERLDVIWSEFTTLGTRQVAWVNPATGSTHRVRVGDGVCFAPTLVGASVR